MAVPAAVATQLAAVNAAVSAVLADRDRINSIFDSALGASAYSLLTTANQQAVKTAITNDMQASVTNLQNAVNALAAM